jgi:hypothetical protein
MMWKNMYPFEEGSAGNLTKRNKVNLTSEYLLASEGVVSLAKEALSIENYSEAEELAVEISSKMNRKEAIYRLQAIAAPPPKRPMYYCQHELGFLPRWTRNSMRYLGDYLDMLVKAAIYEKTGRHTKKPLGGAIGEFSSCYPDQKQLINWLEEYNKILYVNAKHDFSLPTDRREHRFTSREVVLTVFITMTLASQLIDLSPMVARVNNDEEMFE